MLWKFFLLQWILQMIRYQQQYQTRCGGCLFDVYVQLALAEPDGVWGQLILQIFENRYPLPKCEIFLMKFSKMRLSPGKIWEYWNNIRQNFLQLGKRLMGNRDLFSPFHNFSGTKENFNKNCLVAKNNSHFFRNFACLLVKTLHWANMQFWGKLFFYC